MEKKKLSLLIALLPLTLSVLFSCKKDGDSKVPPPDPVDSMKVYKQYGTPFQDVPAAPDVVMYEVNLRAFSPGWNLQSVINRLGHIKDLGVNVIWLMPIHPIGQVNSVNSPYSVKDYKAVSTEFGSLQDLRALTDAAHTKGIAVIMDWVANHTSWDNAWISNKSWYTQNASGNIIHPAGTNWQDVADLNYSNQEMRLAMIDAMKYWVYEANIDGFRCDYADGVPFSFWKQAFDMLAKIPNRKYVLLAEGARADHFDAGFHLNFGWNFYGAIKDAFNGQQASKVFTAHHNEYNNAPPGKHWLRFTTNHDESAWDQTPIALFNGTDGALAASVVTIFTGGAPLIYSSQEVGTASNVPFFSNSTINWNNNPGMLLAYQEMLQFYVQSEVAKKGSNTIFSDNDVVCFKKSINEEDVLVIVNIRNTARTFSLPAGLQNSTWKHFSTNSGVALGNQIQLAAYQYFILKE